MQHSEQTECSGVLPVLLCRRVFSEKVGQQVGQAYSGQELQFKASQAQSRRGDRRFVPDIEGDWKRPTDLKS